MRFATVALTLALVSGAHAGAIIKISSNDPARVQVDGEDLGVTPITLRDMKPGTYEIKLENVRSGMVQTYSIKSPKSGTVEREITAKWAEAQSQTEPSASAGAAVRAPVAAPAAAPAAQIESQLGAPANPVADALAADAPPVQQGAARNRNIKVKARNVLIGTALANELLNKGKSKKTVRNAAVGIGLLNEVLTK